MVREGRANHPPHSTGVLFGARMLAVFNRGGLTAAQAITITGR